MFRPSVTEVKPVRVERRQARDSGSEDEEAGELGKPFTQLKAFGKGDVDGDEEEWTQWLDWDALDGGSGSGA